jgi:hypothetical protein
VRAESCHRGLQFDPILSIQNDLQPCHSRVVRSGCALTYPCPSAKSAWVPSLISRSVSMEPMGARAVVWSEPLVSVVRAHSKAARKVIRWAMCSSTVTPRCSHPTVIVARSTFAANAVSLTFFLIEEAFISP